MCILDSSSSTVHFYSAKASAVWHNRFEWAQESTIITLEASLCAIASMASDPIHLLVVVPSMAFLGHVLPYTGMSDAKIAVNVPSIFKIKTQIDSLAVNSTDFINGYSSFFFHFPLWNQSSIVFYIIFVKIYYERMKISNRCFYFCPQICSLRWLNYWIFSRFLAYCVYCLPVLTLSTHSHQKTE